jgi:hypothetical protein
MKIELIITEHTVIAEIISDEKVISSYQDAVDLMANCRYQGADKIVLKEKNIVDDFFDLKSGVAGEILQKFSNYKCQLAIIGDFSKFQSKSLKDFIFESNKIGRICFVSSAEEAKKYLSRNIG